jgi:hypothetical protein
LTVALYRVNFELRGSPRSLLKLLPGPPAVGQQLSFENLGLVVTQVDPEPADRGIAATVHAAVERRDPPAQ